MLFWADCVIFVKCCGGFFFFVSSTSAAGYCARFQADTTYERIRHGKRSRSLYRLTLSLCKLFWLNSKHKSGISHQMLKNNLGCTDKAVCHLSGFCCCTYNLGTVIYNFSSDNKSKTYLILCLNMFNQNFF